MSAHLILTLALTLFAEEDTAKKVDGIFQPWNNSTGPGASVAVIHKGKLILEKGYGLANLEYDIPNKPDTIFHVASVSKQFTAMALLLLESDGELSIDDDIHKYLPELPDYGAPVTIRQLLQHTSGIRDQWQTLALAGWSLEDVITQDQILRMLFRQKALNFSPGSEHLYSNGGYTLAAEIVFRVARKPLVQFCDDRIFKPLGMTNTHFHQDLHRIVKNRAYSYSGTNGSYSYLPLNYANVGATSLFTTATDLTKWLDNFRQPKVGSRAAISRLLETAVLNDGKKIDYALGVSVGKFRGLPTISHGGADAGYRSYVTWFPDQQLGIAVAGNAAGLNSAQIANRIAAIYLERELAPEPPKPDPVKRTFVPVEPSVLKTFAGVYTVPGLSQTFAAVVDDNKLFLTGVFPVRLEMKALSSSRFFVEATTSEVEFTPTANDGMRVRITRSGASSEGERTALSVETNPDLRSYTGNYWSEELATQYSFFVSGGGLKAAHLHHGMSSLLHVANDSFRSVDQWFMPQVTFHRDGEGRVNGVTLGGGRIRGIRFVRK